MIDDLGRSPLALGTKITKLVDTRAGDLLGRRLGGVK
jgi:hypothetical protein